MKNRQQSKIRLGLHFIAAWAAVCCLICLSFSMTATAAEADDAYYVTDDAGLLTADEAASLAERLRAISFARQCDVIVYTTEDNIWDADFDAFCTDRYRDEGYAGDGVQFSIGMAHRTWDLYLSGRCVDALDYDAQEELYEAVIDYLGAGYYYDAFMIYADYVESFLYTYDADDGDRPSAVPVTGHEEIPESSYTPQPASTGSKRGVSPFGAGLSLISSLGISGATVSGMKRQNKSIRRQSGARNYLAAGCLENSLQRTDNFINNHVVRTPIAVARSDSGNRPGSGRPSSGMRPTSHQPMHRPPTNTSGTFRRTGSGGSHGRF